LVSTQTSANLISTTRSDVTDRATLTARQREILEFISATVHHRGYPPSVREIGDAVGLSSPSTVHSHLSSLANGGFIRKDPSKPRAIEVIAPDGVVPISRAATRDVPLVGHIAAGSPILAEEDIEEIYPLPTELVGREPVFMLRIRGDSMMNVGIYDGDYVVVQKQQTARNGQVVAALVDGEEATIKTFHRSDTAVTLTPENDAYEPMIFSGGVEILGVVVAVLRRLG
jgi:repressor LexA